jgi:hypothetical protein
MTGKPGRIEASGRLGAGVQDSSPNMKRAECAMNSRRDNVSVSSRGLSDPVPSGKIPPMALDVRFKISSPPEDFHVAIRGRKDTQTNSNADRGVDGRYFVWAMIRNFEVFLSAVDAVVSIPKRSGHSVNLSMLRRRRAGIVASEGQISVIFLSILYRLSALMSNICKKYVEDCLRDAAL